MLTRKKVKLPFAYKLFYEQVAKCKHLYIFVLQLNYLQVCVSFPLAQSRYTIKCIGCIEHISYIL